MVCGNFSSTFFHILQKNMEPRGEFLLKNHPARILTWSHILAIEKIGDWEKLEILDQNQSF